MQTNLLSRFFSKDLYIEDTSLVLRPPAWSDFEQWLDLRITSMNFLVEWEPKWPQDDLTKEGFKRRLHHYANGLKKGTARAYFLHDTRRGQLLGGLSLTRIKKAPPSSALLGYWMGKPYAGQGYMQKAVPCALKYAFDVLKLEKVDAAVIPKNKRSIHLLEKCGFQKIGFAEKYLEINGCHEDHILYAITHSEYNGKTNKIKSGKASLPVV